MEYYLGIDIGASSGRHIVGHKENDQIVLDEVYRFYNHIKNDNGHLIWDIDYLFKEIKAGIKEAFSKYKNIKSLAIDTWGLDYVLLNNDEIIYPCYAYRDFRTKKVIDKVHSLISFDRLYEITGIQFLEYNTIYQLYEDKESGRLAKATDYLLMPEFFNYMLTGKKVKEFTNASTGGMINTKTNDFDSEIISKLGFNKDLFTKPNMRGTFVGKLKDDIAKEVNGNLDVVLCPSHDTASAYDAIDTPNNSIIISSGTWSLIGTKLKDACTSKKAYNANFSNEGGIGYTRFLKNIMGMWLINEIQRKENLPFTTIVEMAKASNYQEIFNVNDSSLSAPADMEIAIKELLIKGNKKAPSNLNDVFNSIYHSLAYSYKVAINEMEDILNTKFNSIYIVGGGAKNKYLNDLVEKYCNIEVVALPIEATAIGNLKSQMERNL